MTSFEGPSLFLNDYLTVPVFLDVEWYTSISEILDYGQEAATENLKLGSKRLQTTQDLSQTFNKITQKLKLSGIRH